MASIPAPWRKQFISNISLLESPTFSLSTLALSSSPSSHGHGGPIPRVRTCVFRGMWTDPKSDERNKAEPNAAAYESDCLMFTTDARMDKAEHILQVKSGESTTQTGGGGPVEAAFWVPEVKMQWRVCGDAWIFGPDVETSSDEGVDRAKNAVKERMRVLDKDKAPKWSWERELTYIFGAQGPMIRGSFTMPPPGKPIPDGEDWRSIKPVDDLHDPTARANFRVVVIRPFEVESLELKDPAKRYRYTYQADGSWSEQRVWP